MGARLSSQLSDDEISAINEETGCKLLCLSRNYCRFGCHLVSTRIIDCLVTDSSPRRPWWDFRLAMPHKQGELQCE